MSDQPVFTGKRAPVASVFEQPEAGVFLDAFLEDFPSASKEQAVTALSIENKLLTS